MVKVDVLIEGGIFIESFIGIQVMCMCYFEDGGLIFGWIVVIDQGLEFCVDVDIYLDVFYLEVLLGGQYNQYSYLLIMEFIGLVIFLFNGCMVINQVNGNVILIFVELI